MGILFGHFTDKDDDAVESKETNYWKNAIKRIELYKRGETWMFNDAHLDIVGEPFILGASEAIQMMIDTCGTLKNKETPVIIFGEKEIPQHDAHVTIIEDLGDNAWYIFGEHKLYLCPCLCRYFKTPPKDIYVKFLDN